MRHSACLPRKCADYDRISRCMWCYSAEHTDNAVRHVLLRQGMLGVRVTIMLPRDPTGRNGPKSLVADQVIIAEPKDL